jgi:hypothetical protein
VRIVLSLVDGKVAASARVAHRTPGFDLDLRAELAVLRSCGSAVSGEIRAEGY